VHQVGFSSHNYIKMHDQQNIKFNSTYSKIEALLRVVCYRYHSKYSKMLPIIDWSENSSYGRIMYETIYYI